MDFIQMSILIIVLLLSATVFKLDDQIKELKTSINQISKQVGVPENQVNEEVKALVDNGEDIKAVKKARELYGFTLLEDKEYVDTLKSEEQ